MCTLGIRLYRRIRDAVTIVLAERDKGIGHKARRWRVAGIIAVAFDNTTEIFEGTQVVMRNAFAIRIHAPELPLRPSVAIFCRVLQGSYGFLRLADLKS